MADPISAAIGGVATIAGGFLGSSGASRAASTQAGAAADAARVQSEAAIRAAEMQQETAREQIAAQERMFGRQVELQEPWRAAGVNALARIQGGAAPLPEAFTGQVNMMADPGYQFRLSEGLKALDRQAAARGGLISGSALKAAQRYGQEYASGEYGAAYNRALTEYNAQVGRATEEYNRLAGQAGIGQTASSQLAGAAGQLGGNISNVLGAAGAAGAQGILGAGAAAGQGYLGAGQARASGYVGQANALTGALGNIGNMAMQYNMFNRMFPSGGGTNMLTNTSSMGTAVPATYGPVGQYGSFGELY